MTTSFQPVKSIKPALAGILAVLVRFAAGVAHLHPIRALRVVAVEPEVQLMDRRLDLDLVGDAEVLELPRADEVVMQLQALLPVVRVIGR